MTNREFYTNIINLINDSGDVDTGAILEMASSKLAKMDELNEKRRNSERKLTPKQIAAAAFNAKLIESIQPMLTDELQDRMVFAEALGVSGEKVSRLMKTLIESGVAEKGDIKVTGKGTRVGYKLAH